MSGPGGTSSIRPPSRWELMSDRVERTARAAGVDRSGLDLIGTAIKAAMAPRLAAIDDDHDPDYLHPGRTIVVLLDESVWPTPWRSPRRLSSGYAPGGSGDARWRGHRAQ